MWTKPSSYVPSTWNSFEQFITLKIALYNCSLFCCYYYLCIIVFIIIVIGLVLVNTKPLLLGFCCNGSFSGGWLPSLSSIFFICFYLWCKSWYQSGGLCATNCTVSQVLLTSSEWKRNQTTDSTTTTTSKTAGSTVLRACRRLGDQLIDGWCQRGISKTFSQKFSVLKPCSYRGGYQTGTSASSGVDIRPGDVIELLQKCFSTGCSPVGIYMPVSSSWSAAYLSAD